MPLAEDLVLHARELATVDKNKPKQVNLRRAASAAYYAAFHVLGDELARCFKPPVRGSATRLISHRDAAEAARKIANGKTLYAMNTPNHACPAALVQVADDFVRLQADRHLADYSTAKTFDRRAVLDLVDRSGRSVNAVRSARQTCPAELQAFLLAMLNARKPG